MLSSVLKNLSILKKFLFINSIVFIIIGCGTIFYLKTVQPNLIKKKTANHVQIIDNTIDHIQRLNIKFNEDDIRKFLFSTRFLFQNLDRVIFFDKKFNLIGIPYQILIGKKFDGNLLEFKEIGKETQHLSLNQISDLIIKQKSKI